tara:strand:- start:276 stop:680 length:405 start_codon:yes stop_codon:yes gene_type:complete
MENKIMKYTSVDKLEGDRLLKENDFFQDLVSLMENEQFKIFFKKHMFDWTSVKSTVIYMKLYDELKTKYKKITDTELEESIVVYLLSKIMRDKNLRPFSIKTVDKIYETGKGDFFEELDGYIKKKDNLLLNTIQ